MKAIATTGLTFLTLVLAVTSAPAQEGARAAVATDAALVIVEIAADHRGALRRQNVTAQYRQVRANREYKWSDRLRNQRFSAIEVGLNGIADDYFVDVGKFPDRKSAALVVPRHDPHLDWEVPAEGFYRDCLVFLVGEQPIASLFLSNPPRSPHPRLFSARFDPQRVALVTRQDQREQLGLETFTDKACPGAKMLPDDGRLAVADMSFIVRVLDFKSEVVDTRPDTARFTVFEVLGEQEPRVNGLLNKNCGQRLATSHAVCLTSTFSRLDGEPGTLALLDRDELVAVITDVDPGGIGELPASGGLRRAPVSGDLSRLFDPSHVDVSVLAGGKPAKLDIHRTRGGSTIAVPTGIRAADLSIEARERMRPFGPVLKDRADGGFTVTMSPAAPKLSLSGATVEAVLVRQAAGEELLKWAAGESESVRLELPFASAHQVAPRIDRSGDAIALDLSGVPWHVVRMSARGQQGGATPAKDWVLAAGTRQVRFVDGYARSSEVAGLLAQAPLAPLLVHPAGERFAGYRSSDVTISLEDLRSTPILTLEVEAEPVVLTLSPDILAGVAPALRLRQLDGSTIDILGEIDRFGASGGRVVGPDGRASSRLTVDAPAIASIEPMGLGAMGPRIAAASALQALIEAAGDENPQSRCEALSRSMALQRDDGIAAHVASSETVVVARRRVADGRYEITILPESALSSRFRVLSGWPAADSELWVDGAWLPAAEAACQEIQAARSSTAYVVVVVDRFAVGASPPATQSPPPKTTGGESNPFDTLFGELADGEAVARGLSAGATLQDLNDAWSPNADEVRRRLTKAGIRSVVGIAAHVDAGQRVYEVIGQVENLLDERSLVRFRSLFAPLFDGSIASTPGELDEHPRSLRVGLEAAIAGELVPLSRLIVLDRPRTDASRAVIVTSFDEPAVLKMRAVDGFLNGRGKLVDAFDAALREGG